MSKNTSNLELRGRPVGRGNPAPENLVLGEKLAWMAKASCINHPDFGPDAWFCSEADGENCEAVKNVCKACPVQLSCLKYGIELQSEFGIFGGYSPDVLRNSRRARRRVRRLEKLKGGS